MSLFIPKPTNMRKLFTLLFVFTFAVISVNAQTEKAKQKIIQQSNVEYLQNFAQEAKARFEANKQKALDMALEKGWIIREDKDGKLRELVGVTENGKPLYYETSNVDAANSTRANTLHNGGSLGLNIEGQGMTAHVWDGGLARTTHQEYDGIGGSNRFSIGDGTTTLHYHSAHVTGTIIASGFDPDAKGMAPQANAVGYEWNNDVSEATTAAAGGMLVSNHSYGYGADAIPDAWFGQYGSDAVDWDGLMYNAPYYLMLVAAGNDGDDETSNAAPLDGNAAYDKLNGHATSKNNLVVANAQDAVIEGGELVSVLINTGSSEGPTDDYRIKPDIAGNGTQLYSSYESADDAYGTISGTSMATPNVTGTLLLLQQYYNDLNGTFMKAATLKGLALHTADDAGATGPDAVFGWGLMNGKAAAEAITNNGLESIIEERTLANGGSYSFDVVANGIDDLVASISWTDPAGTANSGTNSSTPALVNDLDIRITKTATTYYPWKLTGVASNTEGDNTVDPYEKIIIDNAVCGDTYTITINHKGTLSASQDYSIIVTGIKEASLDAGIVDVSPSVSSCEYSNNTPIDITVANQGGSTASNVDVAYEIRKSDNSLVGNGTYTIASIAACNTYVTTIYGDMSQNGETYTVDVTIVLAGDENSANNHYIGSFMPMNVDLTVPGSEYSTSFEAGSLAEIGWSYEDLNGDGGQGVWSVYTDAGLANSGSGFALMFSGAASLQSDDWLFSPCLYLKAGQTYEVSYYSIEFQDKAESIALYLGTDATSGSMSTLLEAAYDPATAWTQRTPGSFTVPSDGVYYLGWHSYNMTDSYAPAIDDVTITNTSAPTLPQVTTDAITNIGATSADGGGNVTVGGSSAVTDRGIVYSTSINPTLSDNVVAAGTGGTGAFSGLTMSGLSAAATYYVRAYATNSSGTVYGENKSFTTLTSMNFVSATTVQNNSNIVNQGAIDEDILEIQIEMDGALSPFSATSFTLSTNGSADAANDITAARLYYTGTSGTFATGNQFGSTVSNPDGSFTITGTQELVDGVNYFWLAYDISSGATDANVVDAECSSITVGSARTPDVTAPAGSREIYVDPCATPVSVFPFNEGFEAGDIPSCWSYEGTAWAYQAGGQNGNPASAHTGSFNALFYHGSTTADVSKLVTPPLDLTGGTSPSLSFWHTQPLWSPDQDELRIYYKTSSGDAWTLLAEYVDDIPDWTKEVIELPNASSEYYIAFEATGAYGYGVGLDDIEILNTTHVMTYVSSTTTQLNTSDLYAGDINQEIIGVEIVTSNAVSPLDATSFTFSTNGSTDATGDIINAKLYYTGINGAFSAANQFGATEVGPNGSFTITGTQTLAEGTNYFWLAYDVNPLATVSNVVDAECNSITIGDAKTPTVQAPAGNRTIIIDACGTPITSFPYTNDFAGNALPSCWENIDNDGSGQIWEFDNPAARTFVSTTTGNGFAILDSDNYGNTGSQDADMISPIFNFTNYTTINLSFEHYFYYWSGSSATVSYSTDGGTTWTEITSWATANEGTETVPAVFSQDLTTELEGQANVRFKWNYTGSWGYYWCVDDITVDAALASTPYTITFDVSDAGDSSPVDGAGISINSTILTTDVNGEATIDLIDGSYPYTVAKSGYDNSTGTVIVSGSTVIESVSLNETTYTVTFAVVDENSQPIENASVDVNSTTITTDVNGEATIDLVNGTYAYTVSKTGYDNATGSVIVAGTPFTEDVTLILSTYTVTFDVSDAGDGHPLDGAAVFINSTVLTTDVNGEATIDLIDGSYPYTAAKPGYDNATGTVVVSGSVVTESVSMNETTYTLTFAVVDEASQPIENASVSINSTTITTDVNGDATIDLVNGTYAYTVSKTGFINATGSATISGAAATEDVTLIVPTYTLTFNVTDAGDSHALDGASIAINSTTLTTDANGQATIDLEDGTYAYTITRTGYDEVTGSVTVSGSTVSEDVAMNQTTYVLTF
ncbi:MAG: hypothetical protein C0599_00090 [Salinivirgaceae bacterium]|nr:MAG: hypothetical protein C0599_00090 [Salinivirgaceae bacterium]